MTDGPILTAGDLRLELAPAVGGAIARFDCAGQPIMRPSPADLSDPLQAACFPLVPFCNRIRDGRFTIDGRQIQLPPMPGQCHPLHGQGWRSGWQVVSQAAATAELAYSHAPDAWPWAYEATLRYQLADDGLTVVLSAANRSDSPMPCGLGLHPYFPCAPDTVLDTRVEGVLTVDAEIMPVDRQPATGRYDLRRRRIDGAGLDNGFDGWGGEAALSWPDRGLRVRIVSLQCRWFQVYSPAAGGVVVAEPVTHANAALNLPQPQWQGAGIVMLEPQASFSLTARFEVARI